MNEIKQTLINPSEFMDAPNDGGFSSEIDKSITPYGLIMTID